MSRALPENCFGIRISAKEEILHGVGKGTWHRGGEKEPGTGEGERNLAPGRGKGTWHRGREKEPGTGEGERNLAPFSRSGGRF
jgi:hypothetical protein